MEAQMIETRWKDLYKAAGIAAIVSEAVILSGLVTYFIWPYAPGNKTTEEIFTLLHNNLFGGLVSLDLFLLLGNVFSILIFLGLYVSLKPVNESYALFALALGLIGVVLLFPARPIFELVSLSAAYTAAASEAARSQYLAAGTALLSLFDGTGWIANTLLGGISLLISSLLMLRGGIYSKATAIVGIATNVATCCFFIPVIGTFLLFLSLPGLITWYFLLARKFFQMAQSA